MLYPTSTYIPLQAVDMFLAPYLKSKKIAGANVLQVPVTFLITY